MLHTYSFGIDEYADTAIKSLSCACADARAFHELVASRIDPGECRAELVLNEEATTLNIKRHLGDELPRNLKPGHVAIIFFAGHGTTEIRSPVDDASRFLVSYDTRYDAAYSTGIDLDQDMASIFRRISNDVLVVAFIDCCFSGRAGGRSFDGPHLANQRVRSSGISLKQLALSTGKVFITACDDNQRAMEDRDIGHGVFTACLLDALKRERPDGSVSVHQLFREINASVRKRSKDQQTPVFNGRDCGAHLPVFA